MRFRVTAAHGLQTGAYLLEVLIAILVLSFGLLGLLGLVLNSMKVSATANYRAVATQEAARMGDTLRANVAALASFNGPTGCLEQTSCYQAGTGGGCTAAQMVCNEFSAWQTRLGIGLPSGSGGLCQGANPPGTDTGGWTCSNNPKDPYIIKVCWNESRLGMSAAAAQTCIYTQL